MKILSTIRKEIALVFILSTINVGIILYAVDHYDIGNNRYYISNARSDEYNRDLIMLTNLITSESKDENFIDKLYVGSVVLNWMRIEGACMEDVIYKRNRFSGVYGKFFKYNSESERAAKMLLDYGPIDSTAIYFLNPELSSDRSWVHEVMQRPLVFKNTNHYFYQ